MIVKILSILAKILWVNKLGLFNGLALIISIYIHEYGHYFKAKNLKYAPEHPKFIPFIGAYVKHKEISNLDHLFQVAFYGPFVGGIFGIFFFYTGKIFNIDFIYQIGIFSIFLNFFNLLPISILDGGKIAQTLSLNIILMLFNFTAVIVSIIFSEYILLALGIIGLLMSFLNKEKDSTLKHRNKKKHLKYYIGLILLLGIHIFHIITKNH